MTRLRAWLRADDGVYLTVLLGSVVVASALGSFWPDVHVPGQTPTTTWAAAGVVATFVAWVGFRPRVRWDRLTLTFLGAVLVAWAGSTWSTFRHGDALDLGYLAVPVVLALIASKRTSGPAVTRAIDVLAWGTALLFLGTLVAQQTGLLDKASAGTNTAWDAATYWVPLSGPLGIYGRWVGPFFSPNSTALVAVFLVVWGASRGNVHRAVVTSTGVLVLVLTGSRTSMIVAALGVVVLAVLWPARRRSVKAVQRVAGCVLGVAVGLGTLFLVSANPSLSGRTSIWPVFVDLWRTDPAGGVGDAGVGVAVEDGRLPGWATVAHSIYLDPLARDGVVVALLVLLVLVLAVVATLRAARRGRPVGFALVVALLVGGITETLFDWRYLGYQVTVLVGAVLVSAAYGRTPGRVVPTLQTLRRPRDAAAQRRADAYVALDAAAAGAEVVRSRFRAVRAITGEPGDDIDLAAARSALGVLAVERPDDIVIAAAPGAQPPAAARAWMVDPTCGTANFAAGLPLFGTSVALAVNGEIGAAAVADPVHDELFWTDGSAAWRWTHTAEDVPLRSNAGGRGVAFDASMSPERAAGLLAAPSFADRMRPVMVATSLAAAWVADGRLAAYVGEDRVYGNPRHAAGFAVACAAGCVATDLGGRPLGPDAAGYILAADAATHASLLAALADLERGADARPLGRPT